MPWNLAQGGAPVASNVVDLTDLLKRSLGARGGAGKDKPAAKAPAKAAKPAAKKAAGPALKAAAKAAPRSSARKRA